jgi:hypothetical protein
VAEPTAADTLRRAAAALRAPSDYEITDGPWRMSPALAESLAAWLDEAAVEADMYRFGAMMSNSGGSVLRWAKPDEIPALIEDDLAHPLAVARTILGEG